MTGSAIPSDPIVDQAAEWAVMAEYGDMAPDMRAALDMWLAQDRRHQAAFLRARAALYAAEDAVMAAHGHAQGDMSCPMSDNDNPAQPVMTASGWGPVRRVWPIRHRPVLAGGAALAAGLAAVLALSLSPLSLSWHDQPVAAGRIVTLKDGSVATLGAGASITVTLSPEYRRITLVSGEATFKVAHDRSRPFVVQAGDVYAQATGTVYSVNRVDRTGGRVKVTEGSVLVWAQDERDQAVLLRAGGELTLKPAPRPDEAQPKTPASHLPPPELAQLAFQNEPIRSAVTRFNRVNSTKIILADPEIGDVEIVGLFRANDPERFAQAVAAIVDGTVENGKGRIVIKSK